MEDELNVIVVVNGKEFNITSTVYDKIYERQKSLYNDVVNRNIEIGDLKREISSLKKTINNKDNKIEELENALENAINRF